MTRARDVADRGVITTADLANVPSGAKNLIINGDMRIDQRNNGSATTSNINNAYTLDRWKGSSFTTNSTIQQVTDVPSGQGFTNSMEFLVSSTGTPASTNSEVIAQGIEGYNVAHLDWGTANAKSVTLSFWVKSSLTGTFCVNISNATNPRAIVTANRSYVTTYTISSANTWEKKTITISGDTSGTWQTNNSSGISIQFPFAIGSSYSTSSADTWLAGGYGWITGTQYVTETASASWKITGVQLEVGDTATEFEHRPYDMELARCQRYFQKQPQTIMHGYNTQSCVYTWKPYVEMRTQPTISYASSLYCESPPWTTSITLSSPTIFNNHSNGTGGDINVTGTWSSAAPTAGKVMLIGVNSHTFSADL